MEHANPLALFWEGFEVSSYSVVAPQCLLIRLRPDPFRLPRCRVCGQDCRGVHDTTVHRVRCQSCGLRQEAISWLAGRQRLTLRMVCWVESLVRLLPVQHVAQLLALHWHTVKTIDHRRLQREVRAPERSRLRRLIMDEFALFKGHRYATVVIDADSQQVLWVGEGRSREAVRPFFDWLGPVACATIETVAMDMNTALDKETRAHCPKARIVYDLFHVVAKFGREVIDRVRVDQANQLRHDKPACQVIKRSRWLLLRNRANLKDDQALKLEELFAANQPLMTIYLLKDQLKELWYAPSPAEAHRRWKSWYKLAMESEIKPLQVFAKRLKPYLAGIIASARYRLNTSVLEGINNKIKVIKRMAYGYRDTDYFFLKIKAASPL